jgi:hypothetical protein
MLGQGVYRTASPLQPAQITVPDHTPKRGPAMHPRLTLILAQQHLADLRRAADHNRVVHGASTTSSHAAPAPRPAAGAKRVSFLRRLRRLA